MRIGILANGDPDDVRTWSGVPLSMKRELEQRFEEVVYIPSPPPPWIVTLKRINGHLKRWTGRGFVAQWTPAGSRRHARQIREQLRKTPVDALLSITVDQQITFLDALDIPIIHHSDTTYQGVADYYPEFSNLWWFCRRWGQNITRRALANAAVSVYPAQWSADSAVNDYGADRQKVRVVPYGANLQSPPSREAALDGSGRDRCRLLWIGGAWDRKGGQITYDTMVELNRRGIDAEMIVVGATPPPGCDHPKLTAHGFLNKQVPEQLATYDGLWRTSAFFMLPSRSETFGAVFCEAAAYGLPAVSAATGGIPDAVAHGQSGLLLPPDAGVTDYADAIAAVWSDRPSYQAMVQASRDRYENVLNWSAWADAVTPMIRQAVEGFKLKA